MVLLIDNYDSFTYNVYQYLAQLGAKVRVIRNDQITLEKALRLNPSHLVISPGPGIPKNAGLTIALIKEFADKIPILGICLGHQAIGEAMGGKVIRARQLKHGKTSFIHHNKRGLYQGLPNPLEVTRYHSLIVEKESLPHCLRITSETDDGVIMSMKHKRRPIYGVQFHPESYKTAHGMKILSNFLEVTR